MAIIDLDEKITLGASAVGLTSSYLLHSTYGEPKRAMISLDGCDIRLRFTGDDPTSSEGHKLSDGDWWPALTDLKMMQNFKAIRTASTTGYLRVTYRYVY